VGATSDPLKRRFVALGLAVIFYLTLIASSLTAVMMTVFSTNEPTLLATVKEVPEQDDNPEQFVDLIELQLSGGFSLDTVTRQKDKFEAKGWLVDTRTTLDILSNSSERETVDIVLELTANPCGQMPDISIFSSPNIMKSDSDLPKNEYTSTSFVGDLNPQGRSKIILISDFEPCLISTDPRTLLAQLRVQITPS